MIYILFTYFTQSNFLPLMICYATCGWLTVKCCKGLFQIWQTSFNFTYSYLIKVATSTWASHYDKPSNVHMCIHITLLLQLSTVIYCTRQNFWGGNLLRLEKNGHSWETLHSGMSVYLYCQSTWPQIHSTTSAVEWATMTTTNV